MKHEILKTDRGDVHYWIHRQKDLNAPCLVFTHGLTANHTMFEKQEAFFTDKYTIITWDVPLHGLSYPYTDFSYKNVAEDLNNILKNENIEKVILIGMSMGGFVSQEFGFNYPEKVNGFVALDTTPFGISYYSKLDLYFLKIFARIANWFSIGTLRKSMSKSSSKTEYSYNKMMEMLNVSTKPQIIEQLDLGYGAFVRENKDVSFKFPVLILLGEYDTTGSVVKYNKEWSEKEGHPLHYIKNAAHFSNGDNPEQVNLEISNFIHEL